MEEIKLNITSDNKEIVIRTGEALPLKEPVVINIKGNIDSASRYINQRGVDVDSGTSIDKSFALVIFNRESLSITLKTDPAFAYGHTIKGEMQLNPDLKNFSINKDKKYSREDLASLLKLNRFYFNDKDEYALLLSKVKNFKADVKKTIESASDNRGNNTNVNNKEVLTDLGTEFTLKIPVFKAEEPSTFIVEVCLDITDGGTRFWLESLDLNELIIKKRDEIFEAELSKFDGFCVIEE